MWQLNLAMSEDEAVQIVDLYDTSGKGEMRYEQLVKDVCAGVHRGVLRLRKKDHHAPSLVATTRGDAQHIDLVLRRDTPANPQTEQHRV